MGDCRELTSYGPGPSVGIEVLICCLQILHLVIVVSVFLTGTLHLMGVTNSAAAEEVEEGFGFDASVLITVAPCAYGSWESSYFIYPWCHCCMNT